MQINTGVLSCRKFLFSALIVLCSVPDVSSQTAADDQLWQPFYISPRSDGQHISLDGTWELAYADEQLSGAEEIREMEGWFQTMVPGGTVHWSLYRAGKLPHMYENLNSKKYEWIEDKSWYYRNTFDLGKDPGDQYVMLCFDGIDYLSRIWLNGEYLGRHEGMFGGPAVEVSDLLREKDNELIVEVRSGKSFREKGWPGRRDPKHIIKGWEFTGGVGAEPFYTLGMWQGVRLEIIPRIHLERPFLITKSTGGQVAQLQIRTEVYSNQNSLEHWLHPQSGLPRNKDPFYGETLYEVFLRDPIQQEASLRIEFYDGKDLAYEKTWDVELYEKRNWLNFDFEIPDPRLWWPNGTGDPDLYDVHLVLSLDGAEADRISFSYGIRTIETRPSAGPQVGDYWDNWQFVINGQPIFIKGVNWMPADLLLDLTPERYDWIVDLARDAGIQMFRIWGAGLIETEEFYRACNEAGIMVWGEYSMANWEAKGFPQDVFEAQALWNIFRLRNHPSLAVHCGGNEYNAYSLANTPITGILERSVELFDPTRPYRRSSPDEGSIHTYEDMDPGWYARKFRFVPFIAESGMHSITDPTGLREIVDPSEFEDLGNMYTESFAGTHPEFIHHFVEFQASRVPRMLSRASHVDNMSNPSLESIAQATQVGAGEFYQVMSELVQANYPVTTGLLPWVFKRPWPVVSGIHLVDGFGQPSAPYYFLKRTYENLHVMCAPERLLWKAGETMEINTAVLNLAKGTSMTDGKVEVSILADDYSELGTYNFPLSLEQHPSVMKSEPLKFRIPEDYKERYFFILAELKDRENKLVSRSVYWPRTIALMEDPEFYENYIHKPQPWPALEKGPWLKPSVSESKTRIKAELLERKDMAGKTGIRISLRNTGTIPAFMTTLNITGARRVFVMDDNFFWLAPGEERIIEGRIQWREELTDKYPVIEVSAWNSKKVKLKLK